MSFFMPSSILLDLENVCAGRTSFAEVESSADPEVANNFWAWIGDATLLS